MAQLLLPDIVGASQQGWEFGTRQRLQREGEQRRNQLNALSQQAFEAPAENRNSLLAQMEGVQAGTGMEYGQQLQQQEATDEDRRNKTLFNMARVMVNAPPQMRAGLYQQMLPTMRRFGMTDAPGAYTTETAAQIDQTAQALVQAANGTAGRTAQMQNFELLTKNLSPEDRLRAQRIELGLDPRAGFGIVQTAQGTGVWNKQDPNSGVSLLNYGGGQGGGAPGSFGIEETDNYVRGIIGKAGQIPSGTPEQVAGHLMPFLVQAESGGNPNAVSAKGARGLAQLMPETMRNPGFGIAPLQNDTPEENVRLGRDYLTAMLRRYNGNVALALAAYNAGPAVADRFANPQASAGGGVVKPAPTAGANNAPSGYQWTTDAAGGVALAPIPGGPADPNRPKKEPTDADQMKAEQSIRKELTDRLKDPRQVLTMYQNLEKAARAPSAANDLSLIFSYMKMLDPGSVVREQEFANAQNAAGVPDQIRNLFNKVQSGQRLNDNQRAQFVASAGQLAGTARDQITALTRQTQDMADAYGYDATRASGMADFRDVQGSSPAGAGATAQRSAAAPARPTTEAEFAALPRGATYIDPEDGRTYRKP